MNIYKRVMDGLHFSSFTQEECEKIISILQSMQVLTFNKGEIMHSEEEGITIYSFSSEKVQTSIAEKEGNFIYDVSIVISDGPYTERPLNVFSVYADRIRPEFYDYIVREFHDGWWAEELMKLAADDDKIKERKDAFKPLIQLAFK